MVSYWRAAFRNVGLLWLVTWPLCVTAHPRPVTILHYEPVSGLQMRSSAEMRTRAQPALRVTAKSAAQRPDLTFSAFGRNFGLVLERNDALLQRLSVGQQGAADAVELYKGKLIDIEGSWARISREGTDISGLIFDGVDYYAVDEFDRVADELSTPQDNNLGGTVIYRLRDTTGLVQDEVMTFGSTAAARPTAQSGDVLQTIVAGAALAQ
ncbi:MAG TPA: hypothetical protein VFJ95_10440, partial [Gammaproteobacteria bacterium]|nr:hypothetical protein [Gammaproteobacteria bacterium]